MADKKYPWYKRNPKKALIGMMGLSLEERGAYNTLLDLIYWKDGKLPDSEELILRFMACNARRWKRLKNQLITLGKIHIEDGFICDNEASFELVSRKHGANIIETSSKHQPNLELELSETKDLQGQHGGPKGPHKNPRIPESHINPNPLVAAREDGIFKNVGRGRIDSLLTESTRNRAKAFAPRHDLQPIITAYADWIPSAGCKRPPTNEAELQNHFISFVKNHAQKNPV